MPSSTECWDFSAQMLPEEKKKKRKKQSFSQTCTRFSRYLKENGSFGDLSLGMTCNSDLNGGFVELGQPTVMNLFPCEALRTDSPTRSSPLTIFYGGQVLVFDDFPAEKAKEIIDLANKGSVKGFENDKEIASSTNLGLSLAKTATQEPMQPNTSSLTCELPIARKASLHRFLEKRKDRIASMAPSQIDRPV